MSLIITLYVREGIVMASDSRLTLDVTERQEDKKIVHVAVGQTDSTYKTFLAPNNIGISTYGAASIQGVPISGYIETFISEQLGQGDQDAETVASLILQYFRNIPDPPNTGFLVAGYKTENNHRIQQIWRVLVATRQVVQENKPNEQGVIWDGEKDILLRLIQPLWFRDDTGNYQQLPTHKIPWQFFTLQDAIDYAIYAVRTTIDAIRFQMRPKTVGGPIDVLVIKPNEASFIKRKELQVS